MNSIKEKNKILIVSESNNVVVKYISHWLIKDNWQIVKLNYEVDDFSIVNMNIEHTEFKFKINNDEYCFKDFHKIYFHKGAIQIKEITGVKTYLKAVNNFVSAFEYYRTAYEISLRETVYNLMHQSITIGKNNGGRINKLLMLKLAKESGFKIPNTIVTSKKQDVTNFIAEYPSIISKSMDINFIFFDNKRSKLVHGLTCEIKKEDLFYLPEEFPLTLFQENLTKVVELRVFFIDDKNFTSAIFSQKSIHTTQDYRNYDDDYPNRVVPFILPLMIEKKLNEFKRKSNLKTGSIDIIIDEMNDYYFLEVNPQGQFMSVSESCNYYLEKKLANYILS